MNTWLREQFLLFENMHKLEKKVNNKISHAMAFKPLLVHLLKIVEMEKYNQS